MAALIAAILDFAAALLHVAIIIKGADCYRFFGAGETMAAMREAGALQPDLIMLVIAIGLTIWGLYALKAGGWIGLNLPWGKPIMLLITVVYAIRAVAPCIAMPFMPEIMDRFMLWSSIACGIFALAHFLAWRQA